jgi:hypothetical protein
LAKVLIASPPISVKFFIFDDQVLLPLVDHAGIN